MKPYYTNYIQHITIPFLHIIVMLLVIACPLPSYEPLSIDLNKPTYKNGVTATHSGGVIASPTMRIQAKHIVYTNTSNTNTPTHTIIAEGDLLIHNGPYSYTGRRLEYDFITKTGIVYEGIAGVGFWFLGGEKIRLNPDKSFYLYNAFVTVSDNKNIDWKIQTKHATVDKNQHLLAKNITVRCFDTPIFWLPSFKSSLSTFTEPPVKYHVFWNQGMQPKISMGYQIYSWESLDLFLNIGIRPGKGGGASIESNYHSSNNRAHLLTRSYLDHDTFYRDQNPNHARTHYRLQGQYSAHSQDNRSTFHATYDYLSDKNLQSNWHTQNFVLNTAKQTQMKIRNYQDNMICGVNSSFRINNFEGMKQQLPEIFFHPKTRVLGNSGILSNTRLNASYLDYVSATDIEQEIPNFGSSRLSFQQTLYRPLQSYGVTITPLIGAKGIIYGDSQVNRPLALGILKYQVLCNTRLYKPYKHYMHCIQPYIDYTGITRPNASPDTPYIFSINDGFNQLNLIKSGIQNSFYHHTLSHCKPIINTDLYIYSFFGDHTFNTTTPKIQGTISINYPSWALKTDYGWNLDTHCLDYSNTTFAWTINEHYAFYTEFRHRGRFYWRKDNPNNFIMEVTRSIPSLENSPLSDGRNIFRSRFQIKLSPEWILRLESCLGWGRKDNKPNYQQTKVDLITTINTSWKLRFTFTHSPAPSNNNDRLAVFLSLTKN